ncbi:MAG: flagellar basal body protein [Candidatus Margulisiibacteriota bacterium]|nr:flagellar basal body protein [Candidatus Margulisiibacteriota bacterium]
MKTLILLIIFPIFLNASDTISNVLFDDTSVRLEAAIYEMNKRQNAAAYNIANASTPGFKPIRFQDEVDEAIRLYGDASMLNDVNVDDEMVKSTKVRLKHSAYIRLLSTKIGITKKVVTLGKGG